MRNAREIAKIIGHGAVWLPVAYFDFVKNYPGRTAVAWPVTVALAIWWL